MIDYPEWAGFSPQNKPITPAIQKPKKTEPTLPAGFIKCPYCNVLTLTQADMTAHLKRFGNHQHMDELHKLHRQIDNGENDEQEPTPLKEPWKKGKYGGDICIATDKQMEFYVRLVKQNNGKWTQNGRYEYKLSQDGKWLIRRPIDTSSI